MSSGEGLSTPRHATWRGSPARTARAGANGSLGSSNRHYAGGDDADAGEAGAWVADSATLVKTLRGVRTAARM
ncbi:MAG: hypothetical protein ABSG43_02825 [Solirubrobacteraceae bacterium]|jgi:hypothetical protein